MAKRQGLNERKERDIEKDIESDRPVNEMFKKKQQTKKTSYPRVTYYVTEEIREAIRIISFRKKLQISETVRELFNSAIPEEIMKEAAKNIKETL